MSIVSEIIARLADPSLTPEEGILPFREIGAATDLAALKGVPPKALPAAYVYLAAEEAGDNHRATGPVLQAVSAAIAIVIVTSNYADARGGGASGDIEVLKKEVRRRLLGWEPPSAKAPIELDGGEAVNMAGGCVWWEERMSTHFFEEETDHG